MVILHEMETPAIKELQRYVLDKRIPFGETIQVTRVQVEITAFGESHVFELPVSGDQLVIDRFAGRIGMTGKKYWPMNVTFRWSREGWTYEGAQPLSLPRARGGMPELEDWAQNVCGGERAKVPWPEKEERPERPY
jgi:hypothetical protein